MIPTIQEIRWSMNTCGLSTLQVVLSSTHSLHFYDWSKKDSFFINIHNVVNHWKSCIKGVGIRGFFQLSYSTSQTKRQWSLSAVHDGNISPVWWGGGFTPHSIYHHKQSCGVRSTWEGWHTPLISPLPLYALSGRIFQDFFLPWLMHGLRISKEDLPFLLLWN
jgi:hypothetical protein